MENLYTPNCIRTYTGKYIDPFDPDPRDICVEDIAHALAQMPRFGGHLPKPYSVAQHSIRVANLLPAHLRLQGLFHDCFEAYGFGDIPSPIKTRIPQIKQIEDNFLSVASGALGFCYPFDPVIKEADKSMLVLEWNCLMLGKMSIDVIEPMDARQAEICFINTYYASLGLVTAPEPQFKLRADAIGGDV